MSPTEERKSAAIPDPVFPESDSIREREVARQNNKKARDEQQAQQSQQSQQDKEKQDKEKKKTEIPKEIHVGQRIRYNFKEVDEDDNEQPVRQGDSCPVGSSDNNILRVMPDRVNALASGFIVGVSPGKAKVTVGPLMRTDGKRAESEALEFEVEVKGGPAPKTKFKGEFEPPIAV